MPYFPEKKVDGGNWEIVLQCGQLSKTVKTCYLKKKKNFGTCSDFATPYAYMHRVTSHVPRSASVAPGRGLRPSLWAARPRRVGRAQAGCEGLASWLAPELGQAEAHACASPVRAHFREFLNEPLPLLRPGNAAPFLLFGPPHPLARPPAS